MSLDLTAVELDRVLSWAREYTSSLQRHVSWLKDLDGKTVPGAEIAVAEVQKDIGANLELMLKMNEHRKALLASATETRQGGDA